MERAAMHYKTTALHTGIVLRAIPEKSRIVILDSMLGKHISWCSVNISAGSHIVYEQSGTVHANHITIRDIINVPLLLARSDLLFLHQVMELSDVSLPLQNACHDVFSLLVWVCSHDQRAFIISDHQKDLILAKLCVLLGLHTTYTILCDECILRIHQSSVDTMHMITLDSKCAGTLKTWLYYCLSEQLHEQNMKTRIFFKKE